MRRRKNKRSTYVSKGIGSKVIHTGYGSIAKTRKPKNMMVKSTNYYLKEIKKLVGETNKRLKLLERYYKVGTWASKSLKKKLTTYKIKAWTKSGRIKLRNNLTKAQITGLHKALTTFLKSKTSTRKGIDEIKKEQIENIKSRLSLNEERAKEVTDEEAEFFYDMFGDSDFKYIADKIGASALQAAIEDAIEANDDENMFIQRLEWYGGVEMQDLDIREKAIIIYNKYVK